MQGHRLHQRILRLGRFKLAQAKFVPDLPLGLVELALM
jgi:hypothetical protein